MSDLAILGGRPVCKGGFLSPVVIDSAEKKLLQRVILSRELSRFMGSPTKGIDWLLSLSSIAAESLGGQYFSFLGGRMVRKFEADFSNRFNVPYAVSMNSATSGLSAAMGALGIGPGDEVITTCLSFNATALSILVFNSIPVFVDVETRGYCLDPFKVEKAITVKTKAILVVHLLGNPADMDSIMRIARKHKLAVIEDCAQAPGTRYKGRLVGTIGDIGVFSFQETKNITTGEGGMAVTKTSEFAKRMRLIRNHGESVPDSSWSEDSLSNLVGMNYRITELTAAVGIAQLKKLDENNRYRIENYSYLRDSLSGLPGISVTELRQGVVPHVFSMLYDSKVTGVFRSKIIAALRAEGVPVGSGYQRLMYENPIFLKKIAYGNRHCPWSCRFYGKKRTYSLGDCPVAEGLIREKFIWFYHINRPNGPGRMKQVAMAFKKVFGNVNRLKHAKIDTGVGYKW